MGTPWKIVIADDHALIRRGLSMLLAAEPTVEVTGEAGSGEELLTYLQEQAADLAFVDISMPGMGGLACIEKLRKDYPALAIVALSMHEGTDYILQALRAGANGYITKGTADDDLMPAIESVRKGELYLSPHVASPVLKKLMEKPKQPAQCPLDALSQREREIFDYLVRGYTGTEIAELLHLSVKTVDTHKTRMMEKLDCAKKSDLVELALKWDVLRPDK